jgi:hypothetical protein
MLRFKPEVRIRVFRAELAGVLLEASLWSLLERVDVEVNSIDDSVHGLTGPTLHGSSLAIDLDTVGDKASDTHALGEYLRRALPAGYDVIFEGDHMHIEYDTHRPPLRKMVTT